MPKITITNRSEAPQGAHDKGDLVYIAPGHQKTVTVSDADYKGLQAAKGAGLIGIDVVDAAAQPGDVVLDVLGSRVNEGPTDADVARLSDDGAAASQAGSDPGLVNAVKEQTIDAGAPADDADKPPPAKALEDMDEAEVRQFITDKTGTAPHPNAGMATLQAKARALAEG